MTKMPGADARATPLRAAAPSPDPVAASSVVEPGVSDEHRSHRAAGRRRPALLALGAVAVVVLVAALLLDKGSREGGGQDRVQPVTEYASADRGEPVRLTGVDLSGRPVDTLALRGGPVVLNVWGSWCAPCRTEAPVLRALSEQYADRDVRFVGINVKDNPSAARAFERRFGIGYPSLDDQSGRGTLALNDYLPASVVPATLVLDAQGRVASRVLGAVQEPTLRALIEAVVAP